MTNFEIIKEACVKANPEIMELKPEREKVEKILDNLNDRSGVNLDFDEEINKEVREDLVQILGRPIRLSDVLLSIGQDAAIVGNGCFMEWGEHPLHRGEKAHWNYKQISWNLHDDVLDHQTPETIDFIASLLK